MTGSEAPAKAGAGDRGQTSVELALVAPLVLAVVLAVAQLLAAGVARELAHNAAAAGAAAKLQGLDPGDAARDALPGWSKRRVSVTVGDRTVRVVLRPVGVLPHAADLLTARATASAGPKA